MKRMSKILLTVLLLGISGYVLADCPDGTFAINFTNNTSAGLSVQVQDASSGTGLTPSQSVAKNQNTTLCFAQDYSEYKLMQYTTHGNLEYPIAAQTLISDGYAMSVYATDSNFRPVS